VKRFRATFVAAIVLALLLVAALALQRRSEPGPGTVPDTLFRFEKDDLVAFRIERPDGTDLAFRQVDGVWRTEGQPWRPSRSMVRRVAHQLHDLDARANVAAAPESADRYGLGPDAIRVTVELADGTTHTFAVGDPNPTSVSWYMRPLPGDRIYVVKKSAMDFYRLDEDAWREDRITSFDSNDATRLEAVVDGRRLVVEKTGEQTWRMLEPVAQDASRDEVRRMLGRVAALRSFAAVADQPADRSPWGLAPPRHTILVTLGSGATIDLHVGDEVPGSDPPQRYAWLAEDDAVYAVRDGLLDEFRQPPEAYRNRVLLGQHEWLVTAYEVDRGGERLAVTRTADGWRWPDGAAISGQTPKRVATRAAELKAEAFVHDVPADAGLAPPAATVHLAFQDGTEATVVLGKVWEVEVPAPPRPGERITEGVRRVKKQLARIEGRPEVVEVDGSLGETIEDLFREHGRHAEREAEKGLEE
jgi:hypothetical protein